MKHEAIQALINQVWFDIEHILGKGYDLEVDTKDLLMYMEKRLSELTAKKAIGDDMIEYNLVSAMIAFEQIREFDATETNIFDCDCLELIAAIRDARTEACSELLRKAATTRGVNYE